MNDPKKTLHRPRRWSWLLLLIPLAGLVLAVDSYQQLHRGLALNAPTTIEIAAGERLRDVLAELARRGMFADARQRWYLLAWARLHRSARHIKAGEYRVNVGLDPIEVLHLFLSGEVLLHQLRLIEGWSFAQVWQAISADPELDHTLPAGATAEQVMQAIGHPETPAEGRFFPDTYKFPRHETDIEFLRKAYADMDRRLQATWQGRAPNIPLKTPEDALILASLIEKETALAPERPRIAGVFIRRLELGMKLQTDPTVIYGMGSAYHGNITGKDLITDTPYNTYTRYGLPPTPICLPGQASLTAAVHPAAGTALYFVSKGDGSHVFSDTLAEHDAAVRRYQLHDPLRGK